MLIKATAVTIVALLLVQNVLAKPSLLIPKKEQPEDMRYYQSFEWTEPLERKAMYEAIANGQYHMFDKMSACQTATSIELKVWLDAFKISPQDVEYAESDNGMRDMDGKEIRDPDYGNLVADWLVRDFAEKHYSEYTEKKLRKIQDKFWNYCLENLPIKPFTKAGKAKFEAKLRAEELKEMRYP